LLPPPCTGGHELWHSESVVHDPHVPPPLLLAPLLLVLPPASPPPLLLVLPPDPLPDVLPPLPDVLPPELEVLPPELLDVDPPSETTEPPSSPKLNPPLLESPEEHAATNSPARSEQTASARSFMVAGALAPIVPGRSEGHTRESRVISR
jgi:hypothetical protein